MQIRRRSLLQLAPLAMLDGTAQAQAAWPAGKSLTLIVPYGAGGSLDATTRLVGQRLAERLGQSVTVENVTGAGGALGFAKTLQANPDGYTLLMAGDSPFAPDTVPGTSPYKVDVLKDLIPVTLVNTAPMVLVAHPSVPAGTLGELIALARKQPGRLNYATSGIGTIPHLATEMIKQQAKVHMVHIPYRGGAQIANDVAGHQVDLAMMVAASALPQVRAKTLKALALTGDTRMASLPGVPTVAETPGFKGFNVVSWAGLYAPAKTPLAIVQRLSQELSEVLKMDAVQGKLQESAATARGGPPEAFASFIERDRTQVMRILLTTSLRE
ncbi:MAG: hypothetical protein RLZZ401_2146 [Pseudomonadota bacterium]|jgi:tripartite-type tricarboxylate transporter receptor subunit TctC